MSTLPLSATVIGVNDDSVEHNPVVKDPEEPEETLSAAQTSKPPVEVADEEVLSVPKKKEASA
jgi:hypothetical protein